MTYSMVKFEAHSPTDLVRLVSAARAISDFLKPRDFSRSLEVSLNVAAEVEEVFRKCENPLMRSGDLLRKFGSPVSAVKFNNLALESGLLVLQERSSTKYAGISRQYKVIPNQYLCYGKNLVSSSNQKETQPYWFESTFQEVLNKLGVTK